MLRLGTNLQREKLLGFEESLKLASIAGFKYVDFDLTGNYYCEEKNEEIFFSNILSIMQKYGVSASQAHAPYIKGIQTNFKVFESDEYKEKVIASIRQAKLINAPYLVIHPFSPYPVDYENNVNDYSLIQEDCFKKNIDFFASLVPFLQKYNIKLAIENVVSYDFVQRGHTIMAGSRAEELKRYLDTLNSDLFCICFDVGHLNCVKGNTITEFFDILGDNIKVLHLHDNFGVLNDWFGELDRHLPPYFGCVKWDELVNNLKKIQFNGVFSFECNDYVQPNNIKWFYEYLINTGKDILGEK